MAARPRYLLSLLVALGAGCSGGSSASAPPGDDAPVDAGDPSSRCDTRGATRPCTIANELGACTGVETCDGATWGACGAQKPAAESCNGVDDNCNGEIDEGALGADPSCKPAGSSCPGHLECHGKDGLACVAAAGSAETCNGVDDDCNGTVDDPFRDAEGRYVVDVANCGACGADCAKLHPDAKSIVCQLVDGAPRCVVTACPPGSSVGPGGLSCVSLLSKICDACQTDADCAQSVGDRCVAGFCGRDCSAGSIFGQSCPNGFDCVAGQCAVAGGGSCACGAADSFEKPCAFSTTAAPGQTCVGTITCAQGTLSGCVAPEEKCNGVDDDCNGVIDDPFVDPTTHQYAIDPHHCGGCGIDCTALFGSSTFHATGVCAAVGTEVARCGAECEPGWIDADQDPADGCECEQTSTTTDVPDTGGVDADCDGIDGQIPHGIFVSVAGDDANPGTRDQPVRTIQHGIDLSAATPGHDQVYVAEGVYDESIVLAAGVSVWGGYSPDFARHDPLGGTTIVAGRAPVAGKLGAVNALGVTGATTILDGVVVRASAQASPGGNSYAVYVQDSDGALELRHATIVAGRAADGVAGASGSNGLDATAGAKAGKSAAVAPSTYCASSPVTVSGGAGSSFTCAIDGGGSATTSGGAGGTTACPVAILGSPGANQASAAGGAGKGTVGGAGGRGGYQELLADFGYGCYPELDVAVPQSPPAPSGATVNGLPGANGGDGPAGAAGLACAGGRGSVVNGEWKSPAGTKGGGGTAGGGGGGGGAAGGVGIDQSFAYGCLYVLAHEVVGASGGGGGAGGCGGFGGSPGTSGGGSFGVFVTYTASPASLPVLADNVIQRGFGGAGGAGGGGGAGGSGSAGAAGGAIVHGTGNADALLSFTEPGGRGGDGGRGGSGGGGSGGCGGASVGIFLDGAGLSTAAWASGNAFPATGGGGTAGSGGPSSGHAGPAGASGLYVEVSP